MQSGQSRQSGQSGGECSQEAGEPGWLAGGCCFFSSFFQPTIAGGWALTAHCPQGAGYCPIGQGAGRAGTWFLCSQKQETKAQAEFLLLCDCDDRVHTHQSQLQLPSTTPSTDSGQRLIFLFPTHPPTGEF